AEYQMLRAWIAAEMPSDLASAPTLQRIEVSPTESVLVEPASDVQLQVTASFSDGTSRDVSTLAVYEPANALATVSWGGLAHRKSSGECTVIVRYLDRQEAVRLTFVPMRPAFQWEGPQPQNYIDEHVFSKLRTLRINPSGLCSDGVFIRRAYLDLLGILPTAEEARQFTGSVQAGKRERLVEQLFNR